MAMLAHLSMHVLLLALFMQLGCINATNARHVRAQVAAPACTNAMDCQLNGLCTNGHCVCDAAWSGSNCGQLNVFPGTMAYNPPNRTAWGGGPPVYDEQVRAVCNFGHELIRY